MVARSLKGPRGKGPLSQRARDCYNNHILLCPTCHTEIDKNSVAYPVRKLLQFKEAHERWVAETLVSHIGKRAGYRQFYTNLLDRMEKILLFDRWTWMIDHLWRDLAPSEAIDSGVTVRTILLKSIWPGSLPRLEDAMRAALEAWSDYCLHFGAHSRYRIPDVSFMVSDHFVSGMSLEDRLAAEDAQEKWSNLNGKKLAHYVVALNEMIDEVRRSLNPAYRQEDGYFLIHDDLGYRNDGVSIIIRPKGKRAKRKPSRNPRQH